MLTYVLCLQDLNEAHGVVAELHSKFFGLPHMFAIVKLLGSRSLPWLVRALLDHLSQKATFMELSISQSNFLDKVTI
jgi:cytoplasmic FMR1 interacting protein